jgi:hypothetical protein
LEYASPLAFSIPRYGSRQPPRMEFMIIREIRVKNLVDNGKTGA